MRTCAACGQENPAGFKFCGACGAALTAPDVRSAALAFYRSVGATRHIREGEALLAVAS